MKRTISMLLAIVLLLGLVGPAPLQVFAEPDEITGVELVLPTLQPGAPIPERPVVQVTTPGVSCSTFWDYGVVNDGVYQEGKRYYINLAITALEGKFCTEDFQINANASFSSSHSFSEDHTSVYIKIPLISRWEHCGYITLDGLPESIAPGAAKIPTLELSTGNVRITGVRWVDKNKNPVSSFSNGKLYFLEVAFQAPSGYYIPVDVSFYADGYLYDKVHPTTDQAVVYFRYSMQPVAEKVNATLNLPQKTMAFSDLQLTVTGNAKPGPITVSDPKTGDPVEETSFLPNRNYVISYDIYPAEGYEFSERTTQLTVNGGALDVSEAINVDYINFTIPFSTCEPVKTVDLTMTQIVPGLAFKDVKLTAPADAPFQIVGFGFQDNSEGEPEDWEHFYPGRSYLMDFQLEPHPGYVFTKDTQMTINGKPQSFRLLWGGIVLMGEKYFAFGVSAIELENLPEEIVPGPVVLPEVTDAKGQVTVTQARWVDKEKNEVDQLLNGQKYYLELTVKPTGGRVFSLDQEIDLYNPEAHLEFISQDYAYVYIPYSLEPDVGNVQVTITGLKKGEKINDVAVSVKGNVIVNYHRIYVLDSDQNREQLFSGEFEDGKVYEVYVNCSPKEGYRVLGDGALHINGQKFYYNFNKDLLDVNYYFNTCKSIEKVELTIPGVAVGAQTDRLTPVAPADAPYTASVYWSEVETEAEATVLENGKRYQAKVSLNAKEGYVFSHKTVVVIDGKEASIGLDYSNIYGEAARTYSFLKKIEKVDLPTLPQSISKGKTLPTSFPVSADKPYTLKAKWEMVHQGNKTVADKNGVYMLTLELYPKKGYEFAEDLKIYGDGQLLRADHTNIGVDKTSVYRQYLVGLKAITQVELSYAQPASGQKPVKPTVPKGAKYNLGEVHWTQCAEDDESKAETVTTFQEGQYVFLSVGLRPEEGYAFAQDVTYYLNGKQVQVLWEDTAGIYAIPTFSAGQVVKNVPKLTAPKVTVSGETLRWTAIENADAYEIYRATSKSGKYTKVTTTTATYWSENAEAKVYYYKVKALYTLNSTKNSDYSSVVSVTYKLNAPVIFVQNDAKGKPSLSWYKVSGAKKYTVYRATSETGKYSKLGTTTKTYYTDSKAKAGTTYFYKVIANASSSKYNSGYSNIVSCGVICGTPSVTVKIDTNTGKPSLSWKKVDGAAKYAIYRDGELLTTTTAVSYADKAAAIDTKYTYTVQALGKTESLNGNPSKAVSATSGIGKPAIKGSINAEGKPVLTWNAVEGAVKYQVYRSTKSTKGYTVVKTVEVPAFTDETATAGKTYYYKVVALGAVSKSAESSYVKLTGKCATPELFVENAASGKPYLSWYKVSGAKKYTVYRATSENGKYSKLGTTTKLTYTDTKASAGTVYFYKVIANASSSKYNSGYSNIVSCGVVCSTPSVKVSLNASGKPSLSWSKVTGAVQYEIYKNGTLLTTVTGTSYTDTAAQAGESCTYSVKAINKLADYNSALSKAVTVTATCATPKANGKVGTNKKPVITWGEVEGATKYLVYRSTSKSKGYKLLGEAESLTYEDLAAKKGKTYYYKVVAVGDGFQSAQSAYAKVKSK